MSLDERTETRDRPATGAEDAGGEARGGRRGPFAWAGRIVGIAVLLGFVALLGFGLLTKAPDTTIDDALSRNQSSPAPGFRLDVLTRGKPPAAVAPAVSAAFADGRVDLRELRGTPVVLNFWASWCIPCREEAPLLQRTWRENGPKGVLVLGLNMQDVKEDARSFLAEFGQTFPVVRDPDNSTARAWGVTGIPETFFLSRDGKVVGHVIGVVSPRQLESGIAAARSGRAVGALRGGSQRPTR